jgi:hypothetical protein
MDCVAPLVAAVWFLVMLSMVTEPLIEGAPILMVNMNSALFDTEKYFYAYINKYVYSIHILINIYLVNSTWII